MKFVKRASFLSFNPSPDPPIGQSMQNAMINYQAIESEVSKEIQQQLTERLKNKAWSGGSGLRSIILKYVVTNDYERAITALVDYVDSQTDYRQFQARAQNYVRHSSDLIRTIENKRNLPGIGVLSLAKRQELGERVVEHFEELKQYLKQIEKIDRESRVLDSRSTVWVLQAMWQSILAIFIVAFVLDLNFGLLHSFHIVTTQILDQLTEGLMRWLAL